MKKKEDTKKVESTEENFDFIDFANDCAAIWKVLSALDTMDICQCRITMETTNKRKLKDVIDDFITFSSNIDEDDLNYSFSMRNGNLVLKILYTEGSGDDDD